MTQAANVHRVSCSEVPCASGQSGTPPRPGTPEAARPPGAANGPPTLHAVVRPPGNFVIVTVAIPVRSQVMRCTLALTLILVIAVPSAAIIRRHDRDDCRYRELGNGYDAVVDLNLPGGAGTLISPTWVITAAHAAQLMKVPHSVIIAGNAYGVTRTVMFPGGGEGKDDLALLELAQAVKNVKPIPIYDGRDEAAGDKMVVFVGQGYSGDGLSGPTVRDRLRRATVPVGP